MSRFAIAALVVSLANLAHADAPAAPTATPAAATPAAAKPAKPDEIADVESQEANLESKEPRKGLTLALAAGGGITVGDSVGRGGAFSLRLGHVATRKTVITFELARGDVLHKAAMTSDTLYDINVGLFAGAQRYIARSFWVRGAGGLTVLTKNANADGRGGDAPVAGVGGLLGGGLDVFRAGYFVFGFEGFGMASVSSDGIRGQLALGIGFSYY